MSAHLRDLSNSFNMNLHAQSQHKLQTETQYQSHQSLVTAQETTTHVSRPPSPSHRVSRGSELAFQINWKLAATTGHHLQWTLNKHMWAIWNNLVDKCLEWLRQRLLCLSVITADSVQLRYLWRITDAFYCRSSFFGSRLLVRRLFVPFTNLELDSSHVRSN